MGTWMIRLDKVILHNIITHYYTHDIPQLQYGKRFYVDMSVPRPARFRRAGLRNGTMRVEEAQPHRQISRPPDDGLEMES